MFFFFFKQKTAYDMRISDWSSDVCSSDLMNLYALLVAESQAVELAGRFDFYRLNAMFFSAHVAEIYFAIIEHPIDAIIALGKPQPIVAAADLEKLSLAPRSEEHTSELQSLMRISYAVFCLKKKKTTK